MTQKRAMVEDGQFVFRYYVVLFFDLLNQRDSIKKLEKIPDDEAEKAAFLVSAKQSAGRVLAVRRGTTAILETYDRMSTSIALDQLTPEQRAVIADLNRSDVQVQSFADTTVLYAPLSDSDTGPRMHGLFQVLATACSTMMILLSVGVAARGGIEINTGVLLGERDLYGPAASNAYELESKVAKWPRVVVGQSVLEYLHTVIATPESDPIVEFNRKVARSCLGLITHDDEGVAFVDFLGKEFRDMIGAARHVDAVFRGFDFVKQEHLRLASDEVLGPRYTALRGYFERRVPYWMGQR